MEIMYAMIPYLFPTWRTDFTWTVKRVLTGWKYPVQSIYFTFGYYFPFPKAGRKIGADPCVSCLLCLSSSIQGMGYRGMWCTTEATKYWPRQHHLGLPIHATHGNWKFFWIEGAISNSVLVLLYRYSGGLESLDQNLRTLNVHLFTENGITLLICAQHCAHRLLDIEVEGKSAACFLSSAAFFHF